MKKKLNEASIMNELREGSLHFRQPEQNAPDPEVQSAVTAVHEPASVPTPGKQPSHTVLPIASTRARVHAPEDIARQEALVEALYRGVQDKQHLASQTFRFQPGELNELDELFTALNRQYPRKLSKNDLVRVALNWLMHDYDARGEESMLAQVLARM